MITFTPEPDFFGEDGFRYWVSDGQSRSAVATVRLLVTPVRDNPAEKLEVVVAPDGEVWLGLVGEPWQRYRIEVSPDLATWQPLVELEGARGKLRFRDVLTGPLPMRFYRATPLP